MKPEEKIALLTSNRYIEQLVSKRDRLIETFKSSFKAPDIHPIIGDRPVTENLKAVLQILVVTFDIYCLESIKILNLYKEATNQAKRGSMLKENQRQLTMYKLDHDRIGDEFEIKLTELTDIIESAVPETADQGSSAISSTTKERDVYRSLTLQKIESHLKQRKLYYDSLIRIS